MLVLREDDIVSILKSLTAGECDEFLSRLEQGLIAYADCGGEKLIHQPLRNIFTTSQGHTSLFMPASDTIETTGIKIVTLPSGSTPKGAINIFAPDGTLDGVLNAEEITAFRTALTTMVAFKRYFTRRPQTKPNMNLVVFGAGKQAEWHIRLALLLAADRIATITVVNRTRGNLDKLRATVEAELSQLYPQIAFTYCCRNGPSYTDDAVAVDQTVVEENLARAVANADAIMCCTPSTKPLFPYSYLRRGGSSNHGKLISLIGSYHPFMQEVDEQTVLSGGKIVVDSKEACLTEAGDLIKAGVRENQLIGLGELSSVGSAEDPFAQDGNNIIFKCVGMGLMDLVVGRQLLQAAQSRDAGINIPDF